MLFWRGEGPYWRGEGPYCTANEGLVRIQCCQLLAKLSSQSGGKIRPLRKKSGPTKFDFLKHLGWWKFCYLCLRAWEKYNISLICTKLERIRGEKLIFKNLGPFSSFCTKLAKNSAAALSGRSTFYSTLFESCGWTIGQLATLRFHYKYLVPIYVFPEMKLGSLPISKTE